MKVCFLLLLISTGLLSKCSNDDEFLDIYKEINKSWVLSSVEIDGKNILANDLTECKFKDSFNIYSTQEILIFKNVKNRIEGYIFGETDTKICLVDPIDYTSRIEDNSCPNIWVADKDNLRIWYMINQGKILKYEVELSEDKMILNLLKNMENWTDHFFSRMIFISEKN